MNNIITLTTDFGLNDEYAGVMKGVILSRAPQAKVIDLTHGIDPQDIRQAAYIIRSAYPYFPTGTVHVVVVDPGVGTSRKIITVHADGHTFVAPDNGVLTLIITKSRDGITAYEITSEDLFLKPISHTFHGRDIMAPVAAALANGVSPLTLGNEINADDLVIIQLPKITPDRSTGTISGSVVYIDHFGNAMTNIHLSELLELLKDGHLLPDALTVKIKHRTICGLHPSYASVAPGSPVAIFGSRNYLEVGVNMGNASELLDISIGDEVLVLNAI